jgi:hypothetical protein
VRCLGPIGQQRPDRRCHAAYRGLDRGIKRPCWVAALAGGDEGRIDWHGARDGQAAVVGVGADGGVVIGHVGDQRQLLLDLREDWQTLEQRLGIAIDLRTYAYVAAVSPRFSERLREMVIAIAGHSPATAEVVGVLSGVLWAGPSEVRGRSLESHSPFRETGRADPALVRLVLEGGDEVVSVGTDGWERQLADVLARDGAAQLIGDSQDDGKLAEALCRILATPIDVGYLQFFPSVDRVIQDDPQVALRLVIRELA